MSGPQSGVRSDFSTVNDRLVTPAIGLICLAAAGSSVASARCSFEASNSHFAIRLISITRSRRGFSKPGTRAISPPLGAGRERGPARPRQSDRRCPVSRQAAVRGGSLRVGRPALHSRARHPRVRVDVRTGAIVGSEPPRARAISALCYAFGGPVLCDYFNIIYLVGAAWTPLAFRATDQWLRLGRRAGIVQLGLVLCMQLLGGDPEAAYLSMICSLGYAMGLVKPARRPWLWIVGLGSVAVAWLGIGPALTSWIHGTRGGLGQIVLVVGWTIAILGLLLRLSRAPRVRLGTTLAGLAGATLLAASLSALQLFPILEHVFTSVRLGGEGTLYRYDFSLFPCRLVEFFWPNIFLEQ